MERRPPRNVDLCRAHNGAGKSRFLEQDSTGFVNLPKQLSEQEETRGPFRNLNPKLWSAPSVESIGQSREIRVPSSISRRGASAENCPCRLRRSDSSESHKPRRITFSTHTHQHNFLIMYNIVDSEMELSEGERCHSCSGKPSNLWHAVLPFGWRLYIW